MATARSLIIIPMQAGMMASQLVTAVLLAHLLSVRDRGIVIGALLFVGLGVTAVSGGLAMRVARGAANREGYSTSLMRAITLCALLSVPVMFVVPLFLGTSMSLEAIALIVLFGPVGVASNCLAATASGEGHLSIGVLIQWLPSLIALVGTVVALAGDLSVSITSVLGLYFLGNIAALGIGAWSGSRSGLFSDPDRPTQDTASIIRESIILTPAAASQLLGLRLDSVLLTLLSGPSQLSIYAAANSMTSPIQIPMAAARGRFISRARRTFEAPTRLVRASVFWLIISAVFVFAASPLIVHIFGNEYATATKVVPILIFAGILQFSRDALANTLIGLGDSKRVSSTEVQVALFALPTYWLLIWWQSYIGAAVASILVYGVAAAFFLRRLRGLRMEEN